MKIREYLCAVVSFCAFCLIPFNSLLLAELSQPLFAPNVHTSIDWDTVQSGMPGLELMKTGRTSLGEISVYKNKAENLSYEGIKFNSIEYGFNKDGLLFVAYKASGVKNWAAFKKLAIENYGTGFRRHESKRYFNYVWSLRGYSVALEHNKISNSSILLLVSG